MILNLEHQVSNNPVLNLDAIAPRIELQLNDFATTPDLEIQAFKWPEPIGAQNISIPSSWAGPGVVALIATSAGIIWLFSQGGSNKFSEEIERQFDSKVVKCGDSWYATGGTQSFTVGGLLELKKTTLDISSDNLSSSDVANGIQFRGEVHVKVKLYREYQFRENNWGAWREASNEAIGGLPLFSGGSAGFLQLTQSPGVFPVVVQNGQYTWPPSFTNAQRPALDCSQLQKELIGGSTPQSSASGIQVEPLFPSPPSKINPIIPTLQFISKDSDGWIKRQDIDLWIKPPPPYNEPPQILEAKGAWLLDKADPINFRVKQRLAVYKTPDINSSVDYYLEPGQAAQIYEGYEKTIRPGVIHLKNDWKDPDTNALYKAGENINFYVYQEGGCYWFMYSLKTNGQLGDGYCPQNGGEVGDVDYGEAINFFKIRALSSDIPGGWIKSTEDLWQVYIESDPELDKQQSPKPLDQAPNEVVPKSTQVIEPLLPKPSTEVNVENKAPLENSNGAQLVMQLLDYGMKDNGINHETEIQDIKQKIDALPKPSKGQRKSARELNDQALSLLNNKQFEGAVPPVRNVSMTLRHQVVLFSV